MANYVPHHRKKIEQLERKEAALIRLIERSATQDRLLEAARKVRDCRIAVVRAKQNEMHPCDRVGFVNAEEKIRQLQDNTEPDVLFEFIRLVETGKAPLIRTTN